MVELYENKILTSGKKTEGCGESFTNKKLLALSRSIGTCLHTSHFNVQADLLKIPTIGRISVVLYGQLVAVIPKTEELSVTIKAVPLY